MAAALHHPHVMAVYDWGEDDGVAFMVLELLKGGSLRSLLDTGDRLTPSQAAHVGRQVAAALAYAHGRGIVHRDIKPANLLFDAHGIVRVADFGLARALAEASWTEPAGTMVGTARYAAPEQAGGASLDGRADLYSLGVVLVEACTGEVPVVGDTAISTLAARAHRGIEGPDSLGPLAPIVTRAGKPAPADRYPDAAAMGSALTAAARVLPPPEPLDLPGLGEVVEDVEPTHHAPTSRFYDQEEPTRANDAPDGDAFRAPVPRPRSVTRRSLVPFFVAGAILLALVVGIGAVMSAGAGGGTVPVPALVGTDEQAAAIEATEAGLLMRVVERRTSDDPAGLVIEQRQSPGSFLSEDGEIEVVVSRGPPPVPLPDVTGLALAEAQAALEQAGFVVAAERRFDEIVPVDVVIGTEPAGGGQAPRESTIKVFVSDGPAPVEVPDVGGVASFEEAAAALEAKRFVAVRREDYSDTIEAGMVIGTDPVAGTLAPRDSEVGVIVSLGPPLVQVPNVTGMSVEAASDALSAAGLVADVENFGRGKPVRAQDPAGGTTVRRGSKVTLFL
jgi:serine/threonine-protein kinase